MLSCFGCEKKHLKNKKKIFYQQIVRENLE